MNIRLVVLSNLTAVLALIFASGCGRTDEPSAQPTAAPAPSTAPSPKMESPAATGVAQVTNATSIVSTTAPPIATDAPVAKAAEGSAAEAKPVALTTSPASTPPAKVTPPAVETAAPPLTLAGLSQDQMVTGLKDALAKGLQQAVGRLGHDGGFLTNLNVRIPMPEKLQKVETALHAMKQDKLADEVVITMNRAAEQAVPEAAGVFAQAVKQMTIEDAKSLLTGPNDAATQYFQKTTSTNLYSKFYPIVQKATEKTGATAAYKRLVAEAGMSKSLGGFGNALGGLLDKGSLDLDGYVTTKAMDGLFKMVAEEEKQIRQNPVARTTDIMQKVFGALGK